MKAGVVAIDGTKLHANACRGSNVDYERIAREILAEANAIDEAEDELYGEARGDELPEQLRTREGRRKCFRLAEAGELASEHGQQARRERGGGRRAGGGARVRSRADRRSGAGREGWLREARRQLERASLASSPIRSRGRGRSGCYCGRRLEEELRRRARGERGV